MKQIVIVIGGGGHAKVILSVLKLMKVPVHGILDSDPKRRDECVLGTRILGGEEVLKDFPSTEVQLVNGLGSVGDISARKAAFVRLKRQGYSFSPSFIPVRSSMIQFRSAKVP